MVAEHVRKVPRHAPRVAIEHHPLACRAPCGLAGNRTPSCTTEHSIRVLHDVPLGQRRNAREVAEVLHIRSTDTVLGKTLLVERDVPLGVLQQGRQPLELESPDAIGCVPLRTKDRAILPGESAAAPQVKQREKARDTGVHHETAPMIKERANIWTTYGSAHRVRSSNVTHALGFGRSVPRRCGLPRYLRPPPPPPAAVRPGYQAVLGSPS